MTAIHQFIPSLLPGDATGTHTLEVREVIRSLGLESDLYVQYMRGPLLSEVHHFNDYPRRRAPGDILLHQLASCSDMADFLYSRPEPLSVNYHNVTPGHFFEGWAPVAAFYQTFGRAQVARLADKSALAIAVSGFNEADLVEAGYARTAVVPVLVNLEMFDRPADAHLASRLAAERSHGGSDWLFVGRIVPNKAQHQLVKALYIYRRLYDPRARLHLVGRSEWEHYHRAVVDLIHRLELEDAVHLHGTVSPEELTALYEGSDLFLSASEHEGFCVPLLEAMHHGLPLVAHAAAAVPETVADAGVLVSSSSPLALAAAAHRVLSDPALRDRLVSQGRDRLHDFDLTRTRSAMAGALQGLIEEVEART